MPSFSATTSEALGFCLNISYKTAYANVNLRSNGSDKCQESHRKSPRLELLKPQLEKLEGQLCASRHQQLQRHASHEAASQRSCYAASPKYQHLTHRRGHALASLQHHCHMNHNVCDEIEEELSCRYEYESTPCLQAEIYLAAEVVSENYTGIAEKSVQFLSDVKYNSGSVVSQEMSFLHDTQSEIILNQITVNKLLLHPVQQPLKSVSHSPANVLLGLGMPEENSYPLLDIQYAGPLVHMTDSGSLQALSDEKSVNEPLLPIAQQPLEAVVYSLAEVVSDKYMPEERVQPTTDVESKSDLAVSQHTDSSILHDPAHQVLSDKIEVNKQLFPIVQKSLEPVFYTPAEVVLHHPALLVVSSKDAINKQLIPTAQPPLKPLLNEDASLSPSQSPYSVPESEEKSGECDSSFNGSINSTVEEGPAKVPVKASVPLQSLYSATNSGEAHATLVAKDPPVHKSLTEVSHKTKKTLISDASKRTANLMRSNDILSSQILLTELELEFSEMNPPPKPASEQAEEKLSQIPELPKSKLIEMKQLSKTIQPPVVDSDLSIEAFDRSLRSSRMVDSIRLSPSLRESLLCDGVETLNVSGLRSLKTVYRALLAQSTKDSAQGGCSSQVHHVPTAIIDREMSKTHSVQLAQSQTDSILHDSIRSNIMKNIRESQKPESRRVRCIDFGSCIESAKSHQLFITLITPEVEEMFGYYGSIVEAIARKSSCRVRLLQAVLNRRTSSSGAWARFAQIEIDGRRPQSIKVCDRMLREKFCCYENRRRVKTENRKPLPPVTIVSRMSDTSQLAFGKQRYIFKMPSRMLWSRARLQLIDPEDKEIALNMMDHDLMGDDQCPKVVSRISGCR